jgi:hypothetical protein
MSSLEVLFDLVMTRSYELRKKNPTTFNGQEFWQPIKKILEPLDDINAEKWKKMSSTETQKIMSLPEYTDGVIDEHNHFIIQQVRIPMIEKSTIKKIIQIALNIGQLRGLCGEIVFDSIHQFVHEKDIVELSQHLTDDIMEKIAKYLA